MEESYYKCKASDYGTYVKGRIYHEGDIGRYLIRNPEDWQKVSPYPTTEELLECLDNGKNKVKIKKILKQWGKTR
jgi:hypothetical protein